MSALVKCNKITDKTDTLKADILTNGVKVSYKLLS